MRATSPALFREFHRALFRAYFEEGRDLGDADVLGAIAREAGADDQGLMQALADSTYAAVIDDTTRAARTGASSPFRTASKRSVTRAPFSQPFFWARSASSPSSTVSPGPAVPCRRAAMFAVWPCMVP